MLRKWLSISISLAFLCITGAAVADESQQEIKIIPVDGKLEFGMGVKAPKKPATPASDAKSAKDRLKAVKTELELDAETGDDFGEAYEESEDAFLEEDFLKETPDTFEGFNRAMFRFNDVMYENVMEPVASTYADVVPKGFRKSIKNFFNNLGMPVRLASSIIQGSGEKSGRTVFNFFLNTVFGFGGLFDVAKMEKVDEDLDQALAFHGVSTGPYVVWPFFGPSTVRGTVGMAGDSALSPTWLILNPSIVEALGVKTGDKTNEISLQLNVKDEIDEMAIDPYLSMRDMYLQHRKGKEDK